MPKPRRTVFSHLLLAIILLVSGNGFVLGADSASHQLQSHHTASMMPSHEHHHKHSPSQHESHEHATSGEDCVCDEKCCLSYTGFLANPQQSQAILHDSYSALETQFYRSVSLDLSTPPPNA